MGDYRDSEIHNYDNSIAVKYGDSNVYFDLRWHCYNIINCLIDQNRRMNHLFDNVDGSICVVCRYQSYYKECDQSGDNAVANANVYMIRLIRSLFFAPFLQQTTTHMWIYW